MKRFLTLLPLAAALAYGHHALASTGPQSTNRTTAGLMLLDVEYETTDNFDLDGQVLFGGYKTAVNPKFSFAGGLGIMLDGELDDDAVIGDGQGFKLFLDGQYNIKRKGNNIIAMTGALHHDRYNFEAGSVEVDWTMTEIKVGGLIIHRTSSANLYGGLEAFIYSDGEIESEIGGTSFSVDAERDDRLNLRLGASLAIDAALDLRAELLLLSEQTVTLASDFIF